MPSSDGVRVARRTLLGAAGAGAVVGLTGLPSVALAGTAKPTDALRQRWFDQLTGGADLDPTDPDIAVAVRRIEKAATSALSTLDTSAGRTVLWKDLASTTASHDVTANFSRIAQIANSWATVGTAHHGDATVADTVLGALDWMSEHRYNTTLTRYDNDWDWEIGAPTQLNNTMVLLYDVIGADRLARLTGAVDFYTPDPNLWRIDRQIATGANRVWIATVVAVRAVLDGDTAALLRVRDALSDVEGGGANSVFAYADAGNGTGEGFWADGSYLQHWMHPYNGGYGKELLNTLSGLLHLIGDSDWQVTDPAAAHVYEWIDEAFDPLLIRGDVVHSVCGREIARPSKQGHVAAQTIIEATLRLIPAAPADTATHLTALAKRWITEDTYRDFLTVTDISSLVAARSVLASAVPADPRPVRHKQYPRMDKAVHRRPTFSYSVSAYSSRIYDYESIQNENLHGWHLSDGMVLLYTDDLGHYSGDYWPTVDPYRLAGTTVDSARLADAAGQRTVSAATWVGGAAVPGATLAAYGMDLRGVGSTLRAYKSWFFVDDAVVCVGSGITGGAATVETVVENRKLADATAAFTVDGARHTGTGTLERVSWCHLDGTGGYVFPTRPTLHALRENRTHTWREINLKYGTDTPVTRPYQTLWQDHGTAPTDGSYRYVQLPMASAAVTRRWADDPPVRIVAADATAHAVRGAGLDAVNFWTAGTVGPLTADGACSVVLTKRGNRSTVAVADPTQGRGTLTVDLAQPLTPVAAVDGVTVTRTRGGVRIGVDTAARTPGATVAIEFRKD
ncbi:polysaccharide lyase 8 family protein [Actinocatenispora rupis]|uniref:Lyase n=1 Tax=Actinocatenispora rupis TaxID=519421 RepID=A0A8J3N9U0_9ACTN|nr:polysaccharide lyase 8 family protein [Actinocatenispora rupis]GID11406.1 lyase [Actinocatenispora rupis]